jgi:phospholipid transport system substrate-binding protein
MGPAYKINDVVVEGISLTITQRQEFAFVIQRNGGQLESLLKVLREKTRQ